MDNLKNIELELMTIGSLINSPDSVYRDNSLSETDFSDATLGKLYIKLRDEIFSNSDFSFKVFLVDLSAEEQDIYFEASNRAVGVLFSQASAKLVRLSENRKLFIFRPWIS